MNEILNKFYILWFMITFAIGFLPAYPIIILLERLGVDRGPYNMLDYFIVIGMGTIIEIFLVLISTFFMGRSIRRKK